MVLEATGSFHAKREGTESCGRYINAGVPQWIGGNYRGLWGLRPGLPLIVTRSEIAAAITHAPPRRGLQLVEPRWPVNLTLALAVEVEQPRPVLDWTVLNLKGAA